MTGDLDQRTVERAAVILKVARRYSGDELDAALLAARSAFAFIFKELGADLYAGSALIELLDAARSICRNRA